MLLRLAWRNLWRNTRRTAITLTALALGVMGIVAIHSVREVAYDEMVRSVTSGLVGHVQIHGLGYQAAPDLSTVVPDAVAVEARLADVLPGARLERRVIGAGLAGSGEASGPAMIMGIEVSGPAAEGLLTLLAGRMPSATDGREAVIGSGLAADLGVASGGELVLVGQATDGSLANDRFTVVGIADTGSSEANASAVFLALATAQSFFGLGASVHQIVVRLPAETEELSRPVSLLRGALDLARMEVLPWTEILPELEGAMAAKRKNSRLLDVIVYLIVSLGVLNTMTMSTFERTRELGVLASLGTRRGRILAMIGLEALLQGVVGFALGLALAWALLHGMGAVDFASLGGGADMLGARLPETMRMFVHPASVADAAFVSLVTALSGGLVPAVRASRLKPVEATRYV